MTSNYDYISMLNMPSTDLSPLSTTDSEFQNDLDLWLNADFSFDPLDPGAAEFGTDRKAFNFGAEPTAVAETPVGHPSPAPVVAQTALLSQPAIPTSFGTPSFAATPLFANQMAINPLGLFAPGVSAAGNDISGLSLQQMIATAAAISNPLNVSAPATTTVPVAAEKVEKPASVSGTEEVREKTLEEVDKRRRNTAASARFRLKKKQREQALEQTAKEMSDKAAQLERRVQEYEMELKWLRQLVTDRDGKKRLRDFYDEVHGPCPSDD
ncbi:hypothetical protein DFJ77DRAFT_450326 [Powellomyces hirtus]|nr:hypothetical protein DFJ77DRAFT_450326 [Powellomyces hirtus]